MLAERVRIPLVERGAVEPHRAARRRPDADQAAHQRGLAGAARTDDAERLAGLEARSCTLATIGLRAARRDDGDMLDVEDCASASAAR